MHSDQIECVLFEIAQRNKLRRQTTQPEFAAEDVLGVGHGRIPPAAGSGDIGEGTCAVGGFLGGQGFVDETVSDAGFIQLH